MQEYIYTFLFNRTLADLNELLNIADDDRKDCLCEVRRRLLTARMGPDAGLLDGPKLKKAGPPETAITCPSGARAYTKEFQENCNTCVNCGGRRNHSFDGVLQYLCYDCDWNAVRTAPDGEERAVSDRILFAGPGEKIVCVTCGATIQPRDVADMAKNSDAEEYWCAGCTDFREVRVQDTIISDAAQALGYRAGRPVTIPIPLEWSVTAGTPLTITAIDPISKTVTLNAAVAEERVCPAGTPLSNILADEVIRSMEKQGLTTMLLGKPMDTLGCGLEAVSNHPSQGACSKLNPREGHTP